MLCMLLFAAGVHGVSADPNTPVPGLGDKVKLGARIGGNKTSSEIAFPDVATNLSMKLGGKLGFTAGAYGEYAFTDYIGLRLTLQYDGRTMDSVLGEQKVSPYTRSAGPTSFALGLEARCISISPTLHVYPFKGRQLCFYGGFQFSHLQKAKAKLSKKTLVLLSP